MMPDMHFKLNARFPWERGIQQEYEFLPASWTRINEEIVEKLHLEHSFVFSETWIFRNAGRIYFKSFDVWLWRRMENISWTDHVRNEEVLQRVQEKRNCLQAI
jgi:hypothetical protein